MTEIESTQTEKPEVASAPARETFLKSAPDPATRPGGRVWDASPRPYTSAEEAKLRRAIERIFPRKDGIKPGEPLPEIVGTVDAAHVAFILAKTERARGILAAYMEPEESRPPFRRVAWDCGAASAGDVAQSFYSADYLAAGALIMEAGTPRNGKKGHAGGVALTFGTDYPIAFESADFRFILAPRINTP